MLNYKYGTLRGISSLHEFYLIDKDEIGNYAILATEGKKIVGVITLMDDTIGNKWISALEILPEYQHRGVGTSLVKKTIARGANALGVSKNNINAINLYKKLGFVFDTNNSLCIRDTDKFYGMKYNYKKDN